MRVHFQPYQSYSKSYSYLHPIIKHTHTHSTSKEMLERDLVELHTFTKMEQHFDTEWNELNEKFAAATAQIADLQAERQYALQR